MKFVLTGGGTGGHLAIARALKEAIVELGHEAIFIGSSNGQDRMWFEADQQFIQRHFFKTTGVVNQSFLGKFAAVWKIVRAFFHSRNILKTEQVDAVISVGGFSAAPASLAALSLGIPFFIHEQNARTGRLNAMLRPYAKAFFSSYDEEAPVREYPVGRELFQRARVRQKVERIIFLGGSQGATYINDLALCKAEMLDALGIAITHQCGERDFDRVKTAYETMGVDVQLVAFTKSLPELLEQSDLAVSRAGASTLWELCANGLPALFIPYPHAAGDHQYYNAQFLVEKELAWCERQDGHVSETFDTLLNVPLEEKSRGLQSLIEPEGAKRLIEYIIKDGRC